jgi:HSP20 family protein
MSGFLERLRANYCGFRSDDSFSPPVNLYETEANYLVCVDLAGVVRESIDLSVQERLLKLRGRRQMPTPPGGDGQVKIHLMEIDHGNFCRDVELPADVEAEKINAQYRDGLLWVELPKRS